jgi:hypothetical protein
MRDDWEDWEGRPVIRILDCVFQRNMKCRISPIGLEATNLYFLMYGMIGRVFRFVAYNRLALCPS